MAERVLCCLALLAPFGLACTPSFGDATAIVSSPRLLAVQASPAEAATGTSFTLTPLYVGALGDADASALAWDTCLVQKPLGDPGPVNPACLTGSPAGLSRIGAGVSVHATVPMNACELFGPSSPPPQPGQPAARPTDPDATGGFYLPLVVTPSGEAANLALERIACQPSGVTASVYSTFESGYQNNANPTLDGLASMDADGGATGIPEASAGASPGLTVSAGERVELQASWPSCTTSPCGGAETFLLIDPTTKQITTQRESMVASFYATGGAFDLDRVGRGEDDTTSNVEDGWTAPSASGPVTLWVVLRDSRGGAGWGTFSLQVR